MGNIFPRQIIISHENDSTASLSSTACPASTSCARYDLFINHRGPDVKATFATDLYKCLAACGFNVFLDEPEMQPGHDVTCQIKQAIETSPLHIAIFSPTYAESGWCLNELEHMWEMHESGRAIILPIFYDVQPAQLRHTGKGQTGMYAKALWNHEEKGVNFQTIQKWRKALRGAAGISGFELKKYNGSNAELLSEVVARVLDIREKRRLKYVTTDEFESTVHRCLAKVVGIVGPGGVGKTALARDFFNSKRSEYSKSCFLSDVKENKSCLQIIDTIDEGRNNLMSSSISLINVLIVLNDVDQADQIDEVLSNIDLGSNSLVLVTSRDKNVIERRIEAESIYNLTGLKISGHPTTNLILAGHWLEELPTWVGHLKKLKELWLRDSPNLKVLSRRSSQLPDQSGSYQLLNRLTELTIMDCGIQSLSQDLENTNELKVLRVHNCPLGELSFRREERKVTFLRDTRLLGTATKLGAPLNQRVCPKLQRLWINCCRDLVEVGLLPTALITLDLSYCNRLREIKWLGFLARLEQLDVSWCVEIEELPSLHLLMSLKELKASGCSKLKSIKGLSQLSTKLRRLYFRQCYEIRELPGVEHLLLLEKLDAFGCLNIQWGIGVVEQLRQRLNNDFLL